MSSENSHFEEKSGIVFSSTEWGRWYQTGNEVMVEVDVEYGTRAKDVIVDIKPSKLTCLVRGNKMFEGQPFDIVVEDESTWTLEDKQLLRIQLVKANPRKDQCWLSLLKDQFYADAKTLNEMRKKLDLEQFQLENPGFNFSNAKLDKNYDDKYTQRMQKSLDEAKEKATK